MNETLSLLNVFGIPHEVCEELQKIVINGYSKIYYTCLLLTTYNDFSQRLQIVRKPSLQIAHVNVGNILNLGNFVTVKK